MSGIRFTATRSLLHFVVVLSAFASAGAWSGEGGAHAKWVGSAPSTLFTPTAFPEALADRQAADVKFTVLVTGAGTPTVNLTIRQLELTVPMTDDGKGADTAAGDRVFSALVHFTPTDARAGRCYDAFASVSVPRTTRRDDDHDHDGDRDGVRTLRSPVRTICATRIPIGASPSNFGNIITFTQGGDTARVIADEVLIIVRPNLGDNRLFALAGQVGGTLVGSVPANNLYQIRFPSPRTAAQLQQAIATLQRNAGVVAAVPNALGKLATPTVTPLPTSDPQLASQANLDRINATRAWRITKGSSSTVIAVVDTGGDFDHPDFWSGSTPRFLTDVGGNLVAADCTSGACAAVTTAATCHATISCNAGMSAAVDTYGHGTLLGGVAAAATDNAAGIAGANWNAPLLSVRYATADGTTSAIVLAAAINYASGQGARIISISTAVPLNYWNLNVCPSVASADVAGRLVVVAAGNDGPSTQLNYPGACAGAVPIANSTVDASVPPLDVLYTGALGSNQGTWISLAAPGVGIISTARTPAACPTCDASLSSATGYATVGGTSLSAPLAAGAAALILAKSPAMTNAALGTLLSTTGVALQPPFAFMKRIDVLAALLTLDLAPTALNLAPNSCIPDGTNSAAGVSAGTLTTVDPDAGLTSFEYTIFGGADAAKFSIGGPNADQLILTDGILSNLAKPSYAVTVRTTDVGGLTFDQGFVVTVCTPVVNQPPVVTGGTFSVLENSPVGTVVGSVVATDPESQPLAYSITGGNTNGAFTINGSGAITVANQVALNAVATPSYGLTVNVSDGVNSASASVTVNLTPRSAPFPNPILVFSHKETGSDALGNTVDRYFFTVSNWFAYSGAMFEGRPDLPPCGLNTNASDTWVDFFRGDNNQRLFGFCALGEPNNLNLIWFGVIPAGAAPPPSVYITLTDRGGVGGAAPGTVYTSNTAVPVP